MSNCASTAKVRYPTDESARAAQSRLDYGDKLEPYRCPDCGGWHLGGHHRPSRRPGGSNPRDPLTHTIGDVTGYTRTVLVNPKER